MTVLLSEQASSEKYFAIKKLTECISKKQTNQHVHDRIQF